MMDHLFSRCMLTRVNLAVLLIGITGALPASAAGLTGQSVSVISAYPNAGTTFQNYGTHTINSGDTLFTNADPEDQITVGPFELNILQNSAGTYNTTSFDGVILTETGANPVTITGASLDPSSTLTSPVISFTSDSVSVDFSGITEVAGQDTIVDLSFAPTVTSTPEPSGWIVLVIGGLGIASLAARQKHKLKASVSL